MVDHSKIAAAPVPKSRMKRIVAFSLTAWMAAAILYFGQHSVPLIALSGVVMFGGFDLLSP